MALDSSLASQDTLYPVATAACKQCSLDLRITSLQYAITHNNYQLQRLVIYRSTSRPSLERSSLLTARQSDQLVCVQRLLKTRQHVNRVSSTSL
jgi:hypothetical protein